jgi:hypothetical protein
MGYRSDVAYKIHFEDKDRFNAFIVEAKLDPNTQRCFDEKDFDWNNFTVDEELLDIRLFAQDVKWYDSYEAVGCHTALLKKARIHNELSNEDNNGDVCWYIFSRVGEDEDDVESEFEGECDYSSVYISRQIIVDWK